MLCFAGEYQYAPPQTSPAQIPNDTFDSPLRSALAVFILLTSENYPSVSPPALFLTTHTETTLSGGPAAICTLALGAVVLHAR